MVSLSFMYVAVILLMAIIGAFRGWAKELLVLISIILALFIILGMSEYTQQYQDYVFEKPQNEFWVNSLVIVVLAFFGYQTPQRVGFIAERSIRVRVQDFVLGLLFGGVNGYFLFGSIWFYLDKANYFVSAVEAPVAEEVANLMKFVPPAFMMSMPVMLAVTAAAFLLIIVVYL